MGDGTAEGSSAIGDGGQAEISLMPDVDGTGPGSLLDQMHVHIFESLQLEVSYVGDLLCSLKSGSVIPPSSFFFLKICFCYSRSFVFPYKF